jgi:hypothetical protein
MMFLVPIKVSNVYKYQGLMAVWPLWLLACLAVTTVYGIILVLRATEYAAEEEGLSRTSTTLLHRAEAHKEMWTPFKDVPALPMTLAAFEKSTRWDRVKLAAQRKANGAARHVHKALRLASVALVFLLPPLHDEKESARDYRARLRIWIGNALAVLCVLLFIIGECSAISSTNTSNRTIHVD